MTATDTTEADLEADLSDLLSVLWNDTQWVVDALCAQTDPELFHPDQGSHGSRAAKKVCAKCPVLQSCRDYALARPELTGIWGGLTDAERKTIRRRAREAAK